MSVQRDISVLVTGANGGLGLETCKHLVRDGAKRLVMACRTLEKAEQARANLLAAVGSDHGTEIQLAAGFDMNVPHRITEGVAALDERPFDVVFLQAGGVTYGKQWRVIEHEGHRVERTIFQNVLGGHLTWASLYERGLIRNGARVVAAGGEGARGIPGLIQSPNFDTPSQFRDYFTVSDPKRPYVDLNAMGVSKFVSALWVLAMAERYASSQTTIWFTPWTHRGHARTPGRRGIQAVDV